jgi:hypothetical protein
MHAISLGQLIQAILNWSEVWALLIPLTILFVKKDQPFFLKPVIVYLWFALIMNLIADVIGDAKTMLPAWLQSNNPLYNIHSIVRFACFCYFFIGLKKSKVSIFIKLIPVAYVVFTIIEFLFFEDFFNPLHLSGNLLSVEAYLLLIYCMDYYLSKLRQEVHKITTGKNYWVVTGLSIYVVVNFFIFLFYVPMIKQNPFLTGRMWDIHNVAYIIFCTLIAKAFYVSNSN